MSEVKQTIDYGMFKKHTSNRPLDMANVRRIKASIQAHNMLEFRPLLVDASFRVLDGQHRLEAAKELGIPIYYQVQENAEPENIILLNAYQKAWAKEEYLNFYCQQGKIEYEKLRSFIRKHDITIDQFQRLNPFQGQASRKDFLSFRDGSYKFPNAEQALKYEDTLEKLNYVEELLQKTNFEGKDVTKSLKCRNALILLIRNEDFDFDLFIVKMERQLDKVHLCTDSVRYYEMFKKIYNYRNSNPLD